MLKETKITFLKDAAGWYADVPQKSRAQNSMVLGADKLCEALANGTDRVSITFLHDDGKSAVSASELPKRSTHIVKLRRIEHDPFGATYWVSGKQFLPKVIWLCNVTHVVTGEHPKHIFVTKIENPKFTISTAAK